MIEALEIHIRIAGSDRVLVSRRYKVEQLMPGERTLKAHVNLTIEELLRLGVKTHA